MVHWLTGPELAKIDYLNERADAHRQPDPMKAAKQAATKYGLAVRGFGS